mmetsp:Transcript_86206/g.268178  ORF Transcript_86206/g.268178 Transcript_86206/m.268178 type:complete len:329 (-) Transcript_86206:228-1214(-)
MPGAGEPSMTRECRGDGGMEKAPEAPAVAGRCPARCRRASPRVDCRSPAARSRTRLLPRQPGAAASPQSSAASRSASPRGSIAGSSLPGASSSSSSMASSKSPTPRLRGICWLVGLSKLGMGSTSGPASVTLAMASKPAEPGLPQDWQSPGTCRPWELRPRLGEGRPIMRPAEPSPRGQGRRGVPPSERLAAGRSGVLGWRSARTSASLQLCVRARASSLLGPRARLATSAPWRKATAAAAQRPRCSRSAPRLWQATASRAHSLRSGGPTASWETRRRVASMASLSASSWLPTPERAAQALSFVVATERASCGASRLAASSIFSARSR